MEALQQAIAAETSGVALRPLQLASLSLSARYQDAAPGRTLPALTPAERLAYLMVRMPATAAAIACVLTRLAGRRGAERIRRLLDLGSGPGTSLWAALDALPAIEEATLVDADAAMLSLGERVWQHHPRRESVRVSWQQRPLGRVEPWPAHDLVLLSYVLGELPRDMASDVVLRAARAATAAVAVVEPGTPRGFERVLLARDALIEAGWRVLAPCPHDRACPLRAVGGEWCHFAARLGRSRMHRRIKGGELGWEDEKFSYVIAGPAAGGATGAAVERVIRRPVKGAGHVELTLCTGDGIAERVVARRDREAYRRARDARWGDDFAAE